MRGKSSAIAVLATVGALLVVPGIASAKVFCVQDPACPAGGVPEGTLTAAVGAADADATLDTVRIGPGTYSSTSVSPAQPIEIVGAGAGSTEIDNTQANAGLIYLLNGQSKVRDLTVGLTLDHQVGIRLAHGSDVERVKVKGPQSLTAVEGFIVENPGTAIRSAVVELGPDLIGAGIVDAGSATISDSVVTAGVGIRPSHVSATSAYRVTVHSLIPLSVFGGNLVIANALLTPYPGSAYFVGADVQNGNAGEGAVLSASGLTIVGAGSGDGILVRSNSSVSTGYSKAIVHGALIRGVGTDLSRKGDSATETADIDIDHSAYDAASISNGAGNGTLALGAGNLTNGADPRFVNAAAGDYRLGFDSPLLDKGPPTSPLSGDDPDLANRPRVRDSDGNGTAVRDIGAYEYQRLAPVASFTATPTSALVGSPFAFGSKAFDPDGDPIVSRAWSFGDGAGATGSSASHAYSSAGTRSVTFSAKDASGLTGSATHTVTVAAASGATPSGHALLPGACANRRVGSPAAEVLTGSAAGDLLISGAGADRLFGQGGQDCLRGGAGKDRLNGGPGNDRLDGGPGKDVLVGGSGKDRIKAGAGDIVKAGTGNDRVNAANGKPNRVACGKGRDRVRADRFDRLSGCERVHFGSR
jgi:PKD repeat protein